MDAPAPLMHSTFSKIDSDHSSELTSISKGFMLFGVRVQTEGSFRKSVSMNNLAQYDQSQESNNEIIAGYVSDDIVHPSGRIRKRGIPWSVEEHRSFLLGLQTIGKGDWRGISRNFVKTRTPTQVASHAQKYFIRQNNHGRRRRRSSLFDISADSPVMESSTEDEMHKKQEKKPNKNAEEVPISASPLTIMPIAIQYFGIGQVNQLNNSPKPMMSIPILPSPSPSKMANLHLNNNIPTTGIPSLSLNLSILPQSIPAPNQQSPHGPTGHGSAYQALPARFKGSGGDNMISVA